MEFALRASSVASPISMEWDSAGWLPACLRKVSGVSGESVQVQIGHESPGVGARIDATNILAAAGRTPNTRGIGLEDVVMVTSPLGQVRL